MFYDYHQNNSGGLTTNTDTLTTNVIIEADSPEEADQRFTRLGGYFNGCENGIDCSCCGDRWYPTHESDGRDTPQLYGVDLTPYLVPTRPKKNWPAYYGFIVHYADGRMAFASIPDSEFNRACQAAEDAKHQATAKTTATKKTPAKTRRRSKTTTVDNDPFTAALAKAGIPTDD